MSVQSFMCVSMKVFLFPVDMGMAVNVLMRVGMHQLPMAMLMAMDVAVIMGML